MLGIVLLRDDHVSCSFLVLCTGVPRRLFRSTDGSCSSACSCEDGQEGRTLRRDGGSNAHWTDHGGGGLPAAYVWVSRASSHCWWCVLSRPAAGSMVCVVHLEVFEPQRTSPRHECRHVNPVLCGLCSCDRNSSSEAGEETGRQNPTRRGTPAGGPGRVGVSFRRER